MRSTALDIEKFDDIVQQIYSAATGDLPWETVLLGIKDYANAMSCFVQYLHTRDDPVTRFYVVGLSDEVLKEYSENFYLQDNTIQILENHNAYGRLVTSEEVFASAQELDTKYGDEYSNDLLRKYDMSHLVGGIFETIEGKHSTLTIQRTSQQGPFEREMVDALERLMLHLRKGFEINRLLCIADLKGQAMSEVLEGLNLGIVLFDSLLRPVYLNPYAEGLVKDTQVLSMQAGNFTTPSESQTQQLYESLHRAKSMEHSPFTGFGSAENLCDAEGNVKLRYVVSPVNAENRLNYTLDQKIAVMMLLKPVNADLDSRIDQMKMQYTLSKSECEVLRLLAKGMGVSEIAEDRARSVSTVRNQVASLMNKVGVSRQSELIRVLLDDDTGM